MKRTSQQLGELIAPWATIVYNVLASLAFLVGGVWVLRTYIIQREGAWNVDLSISTQSVPYNREVYSVVIRVALQNCGKRAVRAGEDGLRLTVVRAPQNVNPYLPLWRTQTTFVPTGQTLVNQLDMLRHYHVYELEPGAAYQETEAVFAKKGDLLLIECQFFGPNEDSIRQYRFAYVDGSGESIQGREVQRR